MKQTLSLALTLIADAATLQITSAMRYTRSVFIQADQVSFVEGLLPAAITMCPRVPSTLLVVLQKAR